MFSLWKLFVVPVVAVGATLAAAPQSAEAQGFGMSFYTGNPGYYGSPYVGGYGSYGPYGAYGGGYGSYRAPNAFYGYGVPYGGYYRGHHHHHHHHHRY